jgi:hypothetical protein
LNDSDKAVNHLVKALITAPGINDKPLSIVCDDSPLAPIVLGIIEQDEVDEYNLNNDHPCPYAAGDVDYQVSDALPGDRSHCEHHYSLHEAIEASFKMHKRIEEKI